MRTVMWVCKAVVQVYVNSLVLILHWSWLCLATEFGTISPGKVLTDFRSTVSVSPSLLSSAHFVMHVSHRPLSWTRNTSSAIADFSIIFSLSPWAQSRGFPLRFSLVRLCKTFKKSGRTMSLLSNSPNSLRPSSATKAGGRLSSWFIPRLRHFRPVRKPMVEGKLAEVRRLLHRLRWVSLTKLPMESGTDSSLLLCRSSHLSDEKLPMLSGSFFSWLQLRSSSVTLVSLKSQLGKMVIPIFLRSSLQLPSCVIHIAFFAVFRDTFFLLGIALQDRVIEEFRFKTELKTTFLLLP